MFTLLICSYSRAHLVFYTPHVTFVTKKNITESDHCEIFILSCKMSYVYIYIYIYIYISAVKVNVNINLMQIHFNGTNFINTRLTQ